MIFTVMYEMTVWKSKGHACLKQLGDLYKGDVAMIITSCGSYNLCLTKFGIGYIYATK